MDKTKAAKISHIRKAKPIECQIYVFRTHKAYGFYCKICVGKEQN